MTRSSSRGARSGRRRFLQIAGLATAASAVNASMLAWAQTRPGETPKASATPAPPDTARSATAAPSPPSEDAIALAALIQRRHGKHLTAKQMEAVTREIENRLQGGRRLRETQLANSDEPDFVFHAE